MTSSTHVNGTGFNSFLRHFSNWDFKIRQERMLKERLYLPKESFVYAAYSQAFPDVIKIGKADNVMSRLVSLNTSMPIHPYTLVASFSSFDSDKSEKEAHKHFAKMRVNKEFFRLSAAQAWTYFSTKQREHLENKFHSKSMIAPNFLKHKYFSAWVSVHNMTSTKRSGTYFACDCNPTKKKYCK